MEGKLKEYKTSGDVRNKELVGEHEVEIKKIKDAHKKALAKKDSNAAELDNEVSQLKESIEDKLKEIEMHKAQIAA